MLRTPAFDAGRLQTAKGRILEGLKQRNDDAASILGREWKRLLYGTGHFESAEPTGDTVAALSREQLAELQRRIFQPGNAIVAVSGDFEEPEMLAALGKALAQVITADLQNNGLFKPAGPDSLPQPSIGQVVAPDFSVWSGRGAEMLVHGYVRAVGDGNLTVGCYLYDVALKQQLVKGGWVVGPGEWRRAAHKCADMVYSRLSGESPFFDSKIAYIAETGPKDRRMKRLAIMDSDGANHRYITTGQAIALTPRYSPDYKSILYLSYFNGFPRIYIYDIASGKQRLIVQNRNPTFAPRWSPDGRWL
ncbi:MAG: hypothetical protein EBR23_13450, partial [Planctomycetia bacterium]|nr:hypothetical protein [Planctomycetia bacterium]